MFSKATVPHNYLEGALQQGVRVLETEPPCPSVSVSQLVLRQSVLHSHAIAVRSGTEVLTYAELDRRASQLARYLVSRGVKTDTPVGLYFDRGAAFVVAALAVLKAGGAYVPLDSSNPTDRILYMVSDSRIPIVLAWLPRRLQACQTVETSFRST